MASPAALHSRLGDCHLANAITKVAVAKTANFEPGSTKLETAASIPPLPVAEIAIVAPSLVPKTGLSNCWTSSMIPIK